MFRYNVGVKTLDNAFFYLLGELPQDAKERHNHCDALEIINDLLYRVQSEQYTINPVH